MKKLVEVKNELYTQRNLGMRVVDVVIDNKNLLREVRDYLKERKFTEAKLIYRNGAYVMTIILEDVTPINVALAGFRKLTKEEKQIANNLYKFVEKTSEVVA